MAVQQTHKLGVARRSWTANSFSILITLIFTTLVLAKLAIFLWAFMWLYLEITIIITFTFHFLSLSWAKRLAGLHVNSIFRIFFKSLVSLHHFYLCLVLYILRGKMLGLGKAGAGLVWPWACLFLLASLVTYVVYRLLSQIVSPTKGGVHGSLDSKVASSSFIGVFGAWAYYVDNLELVGSKCLLICAKFA